jgi:hypothetical protein
MLLYVSRLLNELDVSHVECEFDDIFVMCELNLIWYMDVYAIWIEYDLIFECVCDLNGGIELKNSG